MDVGTIFRNPRDMMASRARNVSRLAAFERRLAERPWHPDAKKVWPAQIARATASIAAIDRILADSGLVFREPKAGDVAIDVPAGAMKGEGR